MRQVKRKKEEGKRKIISYLRYLLSFAFICENLNAQSNQTIYTQFLQKIVAQEGMSFLSYNGYARNIDSFYFKTDSFSEKRLIPQKWDINYLSVSKKRYLRQLSLQMRIQTKDTFHTFSTEYQDTLTKSQVKVLLRKEKGDFQGKNPFWRDVYLKPAVIVVSSVAIVFALFYVRSQ